MKDKVAIVIPVYNEILGIKKSIQAFSWDDNELEVFFVDDGSTDGSQSFIEENIISSKQHLIKIAHNQGYGAACKHGAAKVSELGFTWVIFADSDLTNPAADLPRMARLIEINGQIDLIKADRFFSKDGLSGVDPRRRTFTKLARVTSNFLFKNYVSDPTNGFRAIRLEKYLQINIKSNDFSIIMEELYKLQKNKSIAVSMPSILLDREIGTSSFNYSIRQIWSYLRWCLLAFFC